MVYEWDSHQQTCYRLYIEEGRSLEEIMEHLKSAHRFAPSKRAFQMQFKRWNFPSKQRPAYKNDRLVSRVKELWERNLAQREMLRVLNEEDGFDIKARELVRVRTRHRWLLRAPNGDKVRILKPVDEASSLGKPEESLALGEDSRLAARNAHVSSPPTSCESQRDSGCPGDATSKANKTRRRRRRTSTDPAGSTTRFPSETTLDESRRILTLDPATYRLLRTTFQSMCHEEGVSKKTLAGSERWEAVKTRLIRDIPQLQASVWIAKDNPELKKLALDVICTDVTKRIRNLETRMTLAEAKNLLGINPEQSRDMRAAFHQVLSESRFTCKSDAGPQQWEHLKRRWGAKSDCVRKIVNDMGSDPDSQKRARALEVLAKDVMKRIRDYKGRKDQRSNELHPPSPAASLHTGGPSAGVKTDRSRSSPATDHMGLDDGMMASSTFDDMSVVSHAEQMAFSPASSAMGAHLQISLQSQASNLSDSQNALPRPSRIPGSSVPGDIGLESQMEPSLLLEANSQAVFMDQPYVQPQYVSPETSAAVFSPVETVSPACAIYLRLHPSSSFVANASLWIATLGSHSVQELRQAVVEKFPGTVCARIEGVLKDGKGRELPLHIEKDQELSAYLEHLQGAAPTFSVQLVWKAS